VAAAASATDAAAAAAARRARRKLIRSMAKNSPYNRRGSLEMVASSSAAAAAATRLVGPSPEEWKQCRHDRDREHLARWYDRLRELEAYRDLHGNCNVPAAYPTNQTLANVRMFVCIVDAGNCNVPLFRRLTVQLNSLTHTQWVVYLRHQKKAYDSDMKTRLTAEKVRHLEDLGFVWELRKQEILDRWSKLSEEKPGEVYLRKPKKPKTEERFDAV
jgi:hypothetical protein